MHSIAFLSSRHPHAGSPLHPDTRLRIAHRTAAWGRWLVLALASASPLAAGVLFEDDFDRSFPGWTAVRPAGAYLDGPLRWQYDIVSGAFFEQSNIYTDSSSYSPTATAPMLINDAVTAVNFTYSARLTAGDDDGFGLVFGYQDDQNFYRVTFARQSRTAGFPWTGWSVDRKVDGATFNLFGAGTPGYTPTFVNAAGQPFDVTVSVSTANRLTLTVVDNPTGVPRVHPLVADQPLPSPADGKVGLFTWGMGGGTPNGFRIEDLRLAPASLVGDPNALSEWTPVVPPRANGSTALTGGSGQAVWSLAAGEAGSYGVLTESGDAFGGNDAAGQVDFTGPVLVAGDAGWTNYSVAVRVTPRDDDGHGLLVRYRDEANFYRIVLRSQVSAIGIPPGLSVQRCVDRAYAEVYRDNPVRYNPVTGQTYDLVATIGGDTLDVVVIADPEGAADVYSYGPMTLSGVSNGRIGLLSWAMSRTEFDWITVQDGATLYVSSPYGAPSPARGLNSAPPGTPVDARAGIALETPDLRRVPVGWIGAGSVPARGSGSNVVFRLDGPSRLHWVWRTECRLSIVTRPGGSVSHPPSSWFPQGAGVLVSAEPEDGYLFAGWTGDSLSSSPAMHLTMDRPRELVAEFAPDTDGDGLADDWERVFFGDLLAMPEEDADGDGRTNREEYVNGTHPKVADILRIAGLELDGGHAILSISNNTGTRYGVQVATDLAHWSTVAAAQFAARFTAPVPGGAQGFWRLQQPDRSAGALPFAPGSWTLAILPDTQVYAMSYPDLFLDQTRWIAANRDRYNIEYVLHLGDITNNNTSNQWQNAKSALSLLDGVVPYALVPGNHDYGANGGTENRSTQLHAFFPVADCAAWPTFGGVMEPGRLDNSYHLFRAGGVDWLVLALEFGPRDSVVAWAGQIAAKHPARKKILITHAYTYSDDTRYDWAGKGTAQSWNPHGYPTGSALDGTNDGEELWRKLVKVHPGFVLVLSGHVLNDGLGRLSTTNDFGEVVHQMLVNYQMQTQGGEAVLRLIEFLPDGRTVRVKAYSPFSGAHKTDPQNQFVLTLDPPLR